MLTFSAAKQSPITTIAGVTPESDAFKGYINEAMERLMYRGDFDGLLSVGCFCIRNGCVVFPRYVDSIREAIVCGQGHLNIKNQWYSFLGENWINWRNQYGWGGGTGGGYNNPWWNFSQCQSNMLGIGRVPTYDTIRGLLRKVRAYPQVNADFGKTVTIFGTDNGGNALQHRDATGAWVPGLVLTLQAPYAETEGYVSHISRVVRDVTEKPVSLYAYNTTDSLLEDLAIYDPGDTEPSFMRYQLQLPGRCVNDDGTEAYRQMTALVKLRYIPVEFDTDLIPLTMPALKLLIQGIRAEESGDLDSSEGYIAKAVRELNHVVQDRNPGKQISVNANPVGNLIVSPV